jgi:hypothetical protein
MNSRINKNYLNVFFLIVTFFSIQWFTSHIYINEEITNTKQSSSLNFEQINYSDDLEVDTSFDLQKRKIFDIDIINVINASNVFISLLKTEKTISLNIYSSIDLYKSSNPRAPPLS